MNECRNIFRGETKRGVTLRCLCLTAWQSRFSFHVHVMKSVLSSLFRTHSSDDIIPPAQKSIVHTSSLSNTNINVLDLKSIQDSAYVECECASAYRLQVQRQKQPLNTTFHGVGVWLPFCQTGLRSAAWRSCWRKRRRPPWDSERERWSTQLHGYSLYRNSIRATCTPNALPIKAELHSEKQGTQEFVLLHPVCWLKSKPSIRYCTVSWGVDYLIQMPAVCRASFTCTANLHCDNPDSKKGGAP